MPRLKNTESLDSHPASLSLVRPATAAVHVLTHCDRLARRVTEVLADEFTAVRHVHGRACLSYKPVDQHPDVIVFDARLPIDVFECIRRMRQRSQLAEIVVVNVPGDLHARAALDMGADDAIGADSPQLVSRLHARVRRARAANAGARIAIGDVVFDREARRTWCAGSEVNLTPRESALLDCLFWHAPEPVSRSVVSEWVWRTDASARRAVIDVYMGYLRRKLKESKQVKIHTIRNVGYAFSPVDVAASRTRPRI